MAASLKMTLLVIVVIVGALAGNTQGIETTQGIKEKREYDPSSNPNDYSELRRKLKCCLINPSCCRIGLRNI
jgi:hypothetical protein